MGVIVLAIIWPDLRVVLFALFIVSLLFGLFTNLELFDAAIEIARDDFLTMSLLFVVSIFYIFMVDRFDQDAKTSAALLREKRNSESVAAITRTISTSLEPKQILAVVIKRFRELMPDVEASILKLDLGTNEASVVAGARGDGAETVRFKDLPTLEEAYTLKETSASSRTRNGSGKASMAVPMISRDEIVAMMYFEGDQSQAEAMNDNRGFVEVVASTAAGALANAEQFENMKELATSDSMTRLANHATFQTRLTHEVERARRHNRTVSLMMVDLDHLKRINDEYGHPMGDRVIAGIAEAIRVSCREIDFGARYGGEEFAVILPETDLKSGVLVAERLRHRIADIDQFGMQVSVSIGVANCPLDAGTADELILAADNALYAAKGGGRNRVSPSPSDV
jgi:diguanylate cyclase (GGDEF)-like protein